MKLEYTHTFPEKARAFLQNIVWVFDLLLLLNALTMRIISFNYNGIFAFLLEYRFS